MITKRTLENGLIVLMCVGGMLVSPAQGDPVGPTFTYQGLLNNSGSPVSGTCDFRFRLYDMAAGGSQVGPTLTFDGGPGNQPSIDIADGLFTADLDFGPGVLIGQERWLAIEIRCPAGGGGLYTPLTERQPLTATPHATFASNAGGFALPFNQSFAGTDTTALSITQTGTGSAGSFRINNAASFWEAFTVTSNGTGPALSVTHTGTGYAGQFQVLNAASGLPAILASTAGTGSAINAAGGANGHGVTGSVNGTGNGVQGTVAGTGNAVFGSVTGNAARAGFFRVTSANHAANAVEINTAGNADSQALRALHTGLGDCGLFEITNAANTGEAVEGRTNGTGDAIQGVTTGTGRAGYFEINNAASVSPAIRATTNGTGPGLRVVRGNDYLDIDAASINSEGDGFFGDPLYLNNVSNNSVLLGFGGGNVGVGGATAGFPAARLHIDDGTDTAPAGGGYLVLGSVVSTNISIDNNEIMARNDGQAATLALNASGGNVTLIQSGTGGVGIGTTTIPTGVLLAVDGKALCEEVEVQLSQNWPDYVFDEDHKLLPLDELEQHIAREKRLPGIPSAEQIAADGLPIGAMQAKTMEKVEELTLYVLQLNRELAAVKQENDRLRRRVETLESSN